MAIVITAKGKDFTAWRAAGDFAQTCRQSLLNSTGTLLSDKAETLFNATLEELERRKLRHLAAVARLRELTTQAAAADPLQLRELIEEFYGEAYAFFRSNRSAPAFFRLGDEFLTAICGSLVGHAKGQMGGAAAELPPLALIALGFCTCHEYTPFWRLQLVLVHGDVLPGREHLVPAFYRNLHEAFESSGLRLDSRVTPLNPEWRGSIAEWQKRLSQGLKFGSGLAGGEIIKLAEQQTLYSEDRLADDFRNHCTQLLGRSRASLGFMVARVGDLSNGVGLMGGFKVERKGGQRGLFSLLDHALLPLAAAVSTLALIKGDGGGDTPSTIRALLKHGAMDVEMAERLLEAWHQFSEMRLEREAELQPAWNDHGVFYVDLETLGETGEEHFKSCLETVGQLQRHVGIVFNSWEEQP